MEKEKLVKKLLEIYLEIGVKDNKISYLLEEISDAGFSSINGYQLEKIAELIEEIMGLNYGTTIIDDIEFRNDGLGSWLNDIIYDKEEISVDKLYQEILKAVEYQQNHE